MAGLYVHFPFCKQACHYCNFHFSTQLKKAPDFPILLEEELESRYTFLEAAPLESIYFGGGSPSLMNPSDIQRLIQKAKELLGTIPQVEITIELNPDDVTIPYLEGLQQAGINRVSLGIQSFWESDLQLMNRAHNREQALTALSQCKEHFDNVSVDLIYGMPGSSLRKWQENLEVLASFEVPHLAAYALTV
jgi:oxygen-independent coproporphyrinogen-3 oxidase